MAKRAERRFHKRRKLAEAKAAYYHGWTGWGWDGYYKAADNMTMCSGPCCGNPRKWFKDVTRQEWKAELGFREMMEEEGLAVDHDMPHFDK